jgi:hypothetical protein
MAEEIAGLSANLSAVQGIQFDTFATNIGVDEAITAVSEGLQRELLGNTAAKDKATNARVDQLVQDLAGFEETRASVVDLASDPLHRFRPTWLDSIWLARAQWFSARYVCRVLTSVLRALAKKECQPTSNPGAPPK